MAISAEHPQMDNKDSLHLRLRQLLYFMSQRKLFQKLLDLYRIQVSVRKIVSIAFENILRNSVNWTQIIQFYFLFFFHKQGQNTRLFCYVVYLEMIWSEYSLCFQILNREKWGRWGRLLIIPAVSCFIVRSWLIYSYFNVVY